MKDVVKITGPCSKWVDGEGWVTEIPSIILVERANQEIIKTYQELLRESAELKTETVKKAQQAVALDIYMKLQTHKKEYVKKYIIDKYEV